MQPLTFDQQIFTINPTTPPRAVRDRSRSFAHFLIGARSLRDRLIAVALIGNERRVTERLLGDT